MSGQPEADRQLRLLVGFVVFGGLFAVTCSVLRLLSHPSFPVLPVLVLATTVVIADQVRVTIRIRSHHWATTWVDAALLVGLAFLPPAWVVLATAAGMAVSKAFRRVAPVRLAFNVAKASATAFVGGAVLLAFDAAGSANTPSDLGALALAFAAMAVVDEMLSNPVLALASRTRIGDRFRAYLDIRLLAIAGRFGVVALAILLVGRAPELLYGAPVVIAVGHLWHERWVRTREERLAWQQLARTTEAFNGMNLDVVVQAAVTGGARLFSADELEVELWLGLDRRLVRGDADGVRFDGDPAQAPRDSMSVYAVPLHGYQGRRDIGAVRLRFRAEVRISDREEAMLASFAASLDTAIRNAAAYGQLDEATQAHAHAAAHDPLTGLANRRELERQLAEALARPGSVESRIAVLLIDLKHFKEVNDTLGHLTGDRVLTQIAQRLADHVRPTDLVARFAGDEFVVLMRDAHRRERVEARAADLLRRLAEPVVVEGLPIIVEASAGLALAREAWENPLPAWGGTPATAGGGTSTATGGATPGTGTSVTRTSSTADPVAPTAGAAGETGAAGAAGTADAAGSAGTTAHVGTVSTADSAGTAGTDSTANAVGTAGTADAAGTVGTVDAAGTLPPDVDRDWVAEVMRRADVAMYQAKRSGRPLVTYAPSGDVADRQRLALAGQLPQAVAQRQFVLVYQPIVELDSGQVVGVEALARWAHPQRGELEPRLFLDLLERSSQLGEFTAAVLEEALTAVDMWKASGHTLSVSVNISPRSLLDENLPTMVAQALSAHGIPAGQLCLELTETLAISQLQTVDQVLGRLRDLGVRLALDDFGTGFSSLAALSRIPVHQLKIDRSFVAALPTDHPDSAQKQQAVAVVRSTVQLGRALDLAVVAEGVETATQRLMLWELGCTHGQGFLFAAPLRADQLLATLMRGVDGRSGTLATPISYDSKVIHLPRPRSSEDIRADEGRSWEGR